MKVSVITVVWNGAKTIATALESVRGQVLPERLDFGHIVGDGISTGNTVSIAKEFASHLSSATTSNCNFSWLSEKDSGLYDAINKGIRMATGDVIGICNADDVLAADDTIVKIAEVFGGNVERVMSTQVLQSGTSIGATITEGHYAASKADSGNRYVIAYKEASETLYWIRLLTCTGYLEDCEATQSLTTD